MANINDVMQDGNLFMEPRLQEYLNKKKYYNENNIETQIPLEKQYNISKEDKTLIHDYLKNKKVYKYNEKDKYLDLVDTTDQKFPSKNFKEDPRFERFKKKMMRNKEAIKQRNNYSEWDDGYSKILNENENSRENIYSKVPNNQKFHTQTIDDPYGSQRIINKAYDAPFYLNTKDNGFQNKYKIQNNEKQKRRVRFNDDSSKDNYTNKIIGNLDSYANIQNNGYQYSSGMDTESKLYVPTLNDNGKKYHNTSRYQSIPYMGSKTGLKDVMTESNLRKGENMSGGYTLGGKAKSHGYSNPVDHYFDFISSDIQDPRNVVLPFPRGGEDTRHYNHSVARPYNREIM